MKVLDRYIAKAFLRHFILVLAVPGALFSLFELISTLEKAGKGTFTTADAIYTVVLTAPERLLSLVPVACFLGALSALGRLSDKGELVAMEAAGMSVLGVCRAVALAWLAITAVAVSVGELAVPRLAEKAAALELKAESHRELTYTKGGFWAKRGFTFLHVGSLAQEGGAEHISIYAFAPNGTLERYIAAESALLGKEHWLLQDVTVKETKGLETVTRHVARMKLPPFLETKEVKALELSPENLSFANLLSYTDALKKGGQNPDRFVLALWRKVASPMFALALAVLASAFVFGSYVERGSMGLKVASGLVIGLLFYFFDQITMQLGLLWGINPVVTAFTPAGVSAAGALFQIKKVL